MTRIVNNHNDLFKYISPEEYQKEMINAIYPVYGKYHIGFYEVYMAIAYIEESYNILISDDFVYNELPNILSMLKMHHRLTIINSLTL